MWKSLAYLWSLFGFITISIGIGNIGTSEWELKTLDIILCYCMVLYVILWYLMFFFMILYGILWYYMLSMLLYGIVWYFMGLQICWLPQELLFQEKEKQKGVGSKRRLWSAVHPSGTDCPCLAMLAIVIVMIIIMIVMIVITIVMIVIMIHNYYQEHDDDDDVTSIPDYLHKELWMTSSQISQSGSQMP